MKSKLKKLKMCLLVAMMTSLALPAVYTETTFAKETPLLWTETKEQWTSGPYELTLSLHLLTPCGHLEQKDISWCEREFEKKLFHPLQELCMEAIPLENQMKRRRKRWINKILECVVTVVLGVTSQLLSSDSGKSDAELNDHKSRVSELENEIHVMNKEIFSINQEVKRNEAIIADLRFEQNELYKDVVANGVAIEKLNGEIRNLEREMKQNQEHLQKFEREMLEEMRKLKEAIFSLNTVVTDIDDWRRNMDETLSDKVKAISNFATYFFVLERQMNEFSRNWRQGRLSDELFDILMISNNQSIVNEYRGAKPKSCRFSKFTNSAVFNFEKNSVDSGIIILEAKPFRLHKPIPDTENVEILIYHGPRNVFYLSNSQCTVPADDKDNGLILLPSADDCHLFEKLHMFQKFWTKSCTKDAALYGNNVQIQQMGEKFFIYCYGQDISIYGHSQPCPNYVFSIHADEQFKITKFGTGTLLRDQNYRSRNDLLTLKVNHRIFPNILQIDFDNVSAKIDCPSDAINYTAIFAPIFVLSIVLLIVAFFYRRHIKLHKEVEQFFNKFKLKDGKGINTMVREEVTKQLTAVPTAPTPKYGRDPPSYAIYDEVPLDEAIGNEDYFAKNVEGNVEMLEVKVM